MKSCAAALLLSLLACAFPPDDTLPPGAFIEAEAPASQVTMGRSGGDRDPEIAPDGRQVLYASSAFGGHFDLYVKTVGSNVVTRLTSRPGDERFPKLNPADSRMLAFSAQDRGEWDICVMEDYLDHPEKVLVISEPGTQDIHPSWSPDGRWIVYSSRTDSGTWILKVYDRETRRTHHLEDIDGLLPEWSPRTHTIVFQRMRQRDRRLSSLWTLEFGPAGARNVTEIFSSDDWAAINPSWSPDGRHVIFATVAKSRARAGVEHEPDDLWTIRDDGSHATRITTHPAADGMPAWSSDGRIYFVSSRSGADRIWSIRPLLPDAP